MYNYSHNCHLNTNALNNFTNYLNFCTAGGKCVRPSLYFETAPHTEIDGEQDGAASDRTAAKRRLFKIRHGAGVYTRHHRHRPGHYRLSAAFKIHYQGYHAGQRKGVNSRQTAAGRMRQLTGSLRLRVKFITVFQVLIKFIQ